MKVASKREEVDQLNDQAWEARYENPRQSLLLADQALSLSRELLYRKGMAEAMNVLGYCYQFMDNNPLAIEYSLEAANIFRDMGDKKGEAMAMNNIGGVYNYLRDYKERLKCNLRSLELRREAGDESGVVSSLNNVGDTYICLKDYDSAMRCFNEALDRPGVSVSHQAILVHNIGEVYYHQGNYEEALRTFERSVQLAKESNYKGIIVSSTIFKCRILKDRDPESCLTMLDRAVEVCNDIGANDELSKIYLIRSQALDKLNRKEEAYEAFKEHYRLYEEVHNEAHIQEIKNIQFRSEVKTIEQERDQVKEVNDNLRLALQKIEDQNHQIKDSILYAQLIQEAMLPGTELINEWLPQSFVLYRPKDVLSGDFYWASKHGDFVFLAVVDCTGHGVPGAMLSMLGHKALNQAIIEEVIYSPAKVLAFITDQVRADLSTSSGYQLKDGMDISLARIDTHSLEVCWAGLNHPLWVMAPNRLVEENERKVEGENGVLYEFLGDRYLGLRSVDQHFTDHLVQLKKGDSLYMLSDGYTDQFGGEQGKKYKAANLKKFLLGLQRESMPNQLQQLQTEFDRWRGDLEQVDDVCLFGVRV